MNTKKRRQPVRSGTLTIVITCVLLLLAVFALLSLITAYTDEALADRQLAFAQQNAQVEREGQEWLAAMDEYLRAGADLPPDTTIDGDTYMTSILVSGSQYLNITARLEDSVLTIIKWEEGTIAQTEESYVPEGMERMTDITENEDFYHDLPETSIEGTGLA